jgi:hypothetical protein
MPNKTQLSPEAAAIAAAVGRASGLAPNIVAPNLRLRDSAAPVPAVELPDLSGPAMEFDRRARTLVCNSPFGLRLGLHIAHRDGLAVCWSIVARRNGAKLWVLDYASEAECEAEMPLIRLWLDDLLTDAENWPLMNTDAVGLTVFSVTGG